MGFSSLVSAKKKVEHLAVETPETKFRKVLRAIFMVHISAAVVAVVVIVECTHYATGMLME
jgi:hypothetical protein